MKLLIEVHRSSDIRVSYWFSDKDVELLAALHFILSTSHVYPILILSMNLPLGQQYSSPQHVPDLYGQHLYPFNANSDGQHVSHDWQTTSSLSAVHLLL